MGQQVFVLMGLDGKIWRPLAVVTDLAVAEQWQAMGKLSKDVDWVPLELDDLSMAYTEKNQRFQPVKLPAKQEQAIEYAKQLEETNKKLLEVIEKLKSKLGLKESSTKSQEPDGKPPKPLEEGGSQPFPDQLSDAQEIADYIETYASYPVDNEFVYELFRDKKAVLRLVPIEQLAEGGRDQNLRSKSNEDKYVKQDIRYQPPILVEDGKVLDGNHRLRANKRRGLTHMWAYVVMENGDGDTDSSSDQES